MLSEKLKDRIRHIFKYLEYDAISEKQHDLIISFEEQFNRKGYLSERQIEILEDIFKYAAENY